MKFTKAIALFILLLLTSCAFAEGVASMTSVTGANGKNLDHHDLGVICKSQHGKTFVDLVFRPNEKNPFLNCSVTIYDEEGTKTLAQFDPEIHAAERRKGLPGGSRVYFHVSDELVDRIEIMYHLRADGFQSHVFTIKRGELLKLARLVR